MIYSWPFLALFSKKAAIEHSSAGGCDRVINQSHTLLGAESFWNVTDEKIWRLFNKSSKKMTLHFFAISRDFSKGRGKSCAKKLLQIPSCMYKRRHCKDGAGLLGYKF